MAAIIKLIDIDEAISDLNYKNKDTLKYKLVHAIRESYADESSSESLQHIDAEDLVKNLWCIGDDPELVKGKRKNLSSVKSSINADLKRLYKEGKNPQGVIIGQNNVFDMSHEAKDKALETIADVLKEKGTDTITKIAEVLKTANDMLSDSGSFLNMEGGSEKFDRMKELLLDLSRKVGFSLPSDTGIGQVSETGTVTGIGTGVGSETGTVTGISIAGYGTTDDTITKGEGKRLTRAIGGEAVGVVASGAERDVSGEVVDEVPGAVLVEKIDQDVEEEVLDEIVDEAAADLPEAAVEEISEDGLIDEIDQAIEDEVLDEIVDGAAADLSEAAVEEISEDGLIDEIDQAIEDEIIDEIVDQIEADGATKAADAIAEDVSIEKTGQDAEGTEQVGKADSVEVFEKADISGEIIEETVDETAADLSEQVIDEVAEEALIAEIDQGIEDEIIDEIVDQIEADGATKAADAIAEDVSIEKTGQDAEGTEGEGGLGKLEVDAVRESQDYQQKTETVGEAEPAEVLEEDDAIDEVAEVVPDELSVNEPPIEGDLEEIKADSDFEEVEGQEIFPEEAVSDEILEDQPVTEGDFEDVEADAHFEEVEGEEALEEEGELVNEVVEEDLREKAEILAKLAEAAKILEKLGPDLSESIYSEKEIKEKAKLLSEQFDRDLSVRERFFNQHILIKGGYYITGSKKIAKNEFPEQKVHIRDFYIGKFPVTNALFEVFVDKTGYRTTAERQGYGFVYTPRSQRRKNIMTGTEEFIWNKHLQYKKVQGAFWYQPNGPNSSLYNKRRHPVVQISLEDARAFAAWTGKRIPTEKEWEAAARTSCGYVYPWGNQWKDNACNIEKSYLGDTTPVDKYLEFACESGVADTLGNVLEWTLDIWESPESGEKNIDMYVVKGGSWISNSLISLSGRYPMDKRTSSNVLGFRCVAI